MRALAMVNLGAAGFLGFTWLIAHSVGDHWVQTSKQAHDKSLRGDDVRTGRLACLAHVATYTVCTSLAVALTWALGASITITGFIAGQLMSAATHYWTDRRFTLGSLASRVGRDDFWRLGQPRSLLQARTRSGELVELYQGWDRAQRKVAWDNPSLGTGAYALDQSFHLLCAGVAVIVTMAL